MLPHDNVSFRPYEKSDIKNIYFIMDDGLKYVASMAALKSKCLLLSFDSVLLFSYQCNYTSDGKYLFSTQTAIRGAI